MAAVAVASAAAASVAVWEKAISSQLEIAAVEELGAVAMECGAVAVAVEDAVVPVSGGVLCSSSSA